MTDYVRYFHAKSLTEASDAFRATADAIIKQIENLKEEYSKKWEALSELRKEYSAIIQSITPILKENGVKPAKPLDRCNYDELMGGLREASGNLPYGPLEEIKVAMVRLEIRYTQILNLAKELESLNQKLSLYPLKEADYEKEAVIVSFKDHQRGKDEYEELSDGIPSESSDLEEVYSVTESDPALRKSLKEIAKETEEVSQDELDEKKLLNESDEEEYDFDLEGFFTGDNDEENMTKYLGESLDEPDSQPYELNNKQTLDDIVAYVYGGKASVSTIYHYGRNKRMIDERCAELDMDPEDAFYTEGALSGLELEFPKNIVANEDVFEQEEKGMAKAA